MAPRRLCAPFPHPTAATLPGDRNIAVGESPRSCPDLANPPRGPCPVSYTHLQGTYVRKERFSGKCSRTFYVGDDVEEDDIKAKFEDGVLKIAVPKKQEQPKLEEKKTISIEG